MLPLAMARGWMAALTLLFACAASSVERQRLADGSWQLTCSLPMDACVREIEKVCKDKRYSILRGKSEIRRKDMPYVTEYHTSRLAFVCDEGEAPAMAACAPGATQYCLGPGACAGAQVCSADGSGFGPCDCGPRAIVADAGVGVGAAISDAGWASP